MKRILALFLAGVLIGATAQVVKGFGNQAEFTVTDNGDGTLSVQACNISGNNKFYRLVEVSFDSEWEEHRQVFGGFSVDENGCTLVDTFTPLCQPSFLECNIVLDLARSPTAANFRTIAIERFQ